MKILIAIVLILSGCGTFSDMQKPDTVPVLVYQTALPAVPSEWARSRPKIDVLFHVSRTGAVTEARFENPTGYDEWESEALRDMKEWRFSPARFGQDSIPVWVRVPIDVRFTDVKVLDLAQLVCVDMASADSAYALLVAGQPFDSVAQELPKNGRGIYAKNAEETDTSVYPENVQRELAKLAVSAFTKPMRIGNLYIIFKRLERKEVYGI